MREDEIEKVRATSRRAASLGRQRRAFLPDARQPPRRGTECPQASVCGGSESHFFMLHIQKRSLVSVNEMMLNRPQEASAGPDSPHRPPGRCGRQLWEGGGEKEEEEEKTIRKNHSGQQIKMG